MTEHFTLGLVFDSSLCTGSNKTCLVWVEPDLGLIIGPKSHHLRLLGGHLFFERLPSSASPWNNTTQMRSAWRRMERACRSPLLRNKQVWKLDGWLILASCLIFCCIEGIQSEKCWLLNPLEPEKSMNRFQKRGRSYWGSVSVSYWVTVGPRHMKNHFQLQSVRNFVIRW